MAATQRGLNFSIPLLQGRPLKADPIFLECFWLPLVVSECHPVISALENTKAPGRIRDAWHSQTLPWLLSLSAALWAGPEGALWTKGHKNPQIVSAVKEESGYRA